MSRKIVAIYYSPDAPSIDMALNQHAASALTAAVINVTCNELAD